MQHWIHLQQLRHSRVQELRGCVVASIEATTIIFYSWFAALHADTTWHGARILNLGIITSILADGERILQSADILKFII